MHRGHQTVQLALLLATGIITGSHELAGIPGAYEQDTSLTICSYEPGSKLIAVGDASALGGRGAVYVYVYAKDSTARRLLEPECVLISASSSAYDFSTVACESGNLAVLARAETAAEAAWDGLLHVVSLASLFEEGSEGSTKSTPRCSAGEEVSIHSTLRFSVLGTAQVCSVSLS
eukprot:SAG11_NODE_46_length_20454_cov_11.499386_7_plen_175_part_00